MVWLARLVRRAVGWAYQAYGYGLYGLTNRQIKEELSNTASLLERARAVLSELSPETLGHIRARALGRAIASAPQKSDNAVGADAGLVAIDLASMIDPFDVLDDELADAIVALEEVAQGLPDEGDHITRTLVSEARLGRARCLASVFETAFGQKPKANNYPHRDLEMTAFMDFFQRMSGLAFDEEGVPSLAAVTKAACRMHKTDPAISPTRISSFGDVVLNPPGNGGG